MLSKNPYLLRAMHQWIVDSGHTPYIVVDANFEGVQVPPGYAKGGKLVLNISDSATRNLDLAVDYVGFSARFAGVSQHVHVPMDAVLAVYAYETGQGMIFEPQAAPASRNAHPGNSKPPGSSQTGGAGKPNLKVVK